MSHGWRLVLLFATISTAALVATPALAQDEPGRIFGVVFDDLDGDGVRDDGEPGLWGQAIILKRAGAFLSYLSTGSQGRYAADGLEPGEYSLNPDFNDSVGGCADLIFSFSPLQRGYCQDFALPRSADPAGPVIVSVESGMTVEINFGTQPADVAVVTGVALLEDDVAPLGASIVAYINGQECGSTTSSGSRAETNFIIDILGSEERAGCAAPSDAVQFRVEGVPAAGSYQWVPYTAASFPVETHHVVAIRDHAWYWFERRGEGLPLDGTVAVQALVDGIICGQARIRAPRVGFEVVGFSRLIVPSEAIQSGCGRPAATVSFLIGGIEAETTILWKPGLQRVELALSGDVDCNLAPNAIDVLLLLQFEAGLVQALPCQDMADVNSDGNVDSVDATLILQFEAGLIDSLTRLAAAG